MKYGTLRSSCASIAVHSDMVHLCLCSLIKMLSFLFFSNDVSCDANIRWLPHLGTREKYRERGNTCTSFLHLFVKIGSRLYLLCFMLVNL